jgi:hypothetical protein
MDLDLQRFLFHFVLKELDQEPGPTNQVLEVTIEESGERVDILRPFLDVSNFSMNFRDRTLVERYLYGAAEHDLH